MSRKMVPLPDGEDAVAEESRLLPVPFAASGTIIFSNARPCGT
jgi:hypothetical protein